ncbi:MAG: SCO family protein [Vicinamibacteraceae bacterium]
MVVMACGTGAFAWIARGPAVQAGVRRLPVTGVVVAAPEGQVVRIAHDDIPDYMPAMTMAFTLAEAESTRLVPGDRVRFDLRIGSGPSVAEGIAVTGRGPVPGGTPATPQAPSRLKRGDALAPFALVDERGRGFTLADLQGHPTVVTFIFTRCPVPEFCPLLTSKFTTLQRALATDRTLPRTTRLLSITLDPAFDTPEVLAAYGKAVGAEPARWRFAGGEPAAVLQVTRAFSVYVERNGALLDHTLATALLDGRGRVVEIWRGNGWQVTDVTAALRGVSG